MPQLVVVLQGILMIQSMLIAQLANQNVPNAKRMPIIAQVAVKIGTLCQTVNATMDLSKMISMVHAIVVAINASHARINPIIVLYAQVIEKLFQTALAKMDIMMIKIQLAARNVRMLVLFALGLNNIAWIVLKID